MQCGYVFQEDATPIIDSGTLPPQGGGPNSAPWQGPEYNVQPGDMYAPPEQGPVYNNPPQMPQYNEPMGNAVIPIQQPIYDVRPYRRKPKALKLILIAVAVLAVAAIGIFASRPLWDKSSTPAATVTPVPGSETHEPAPPVCSYDSPSVVRPALYLSTDYLVYFKGSSEADKEVMLTVEVPGFTQKYEQKLTLKPQEFRIKVRPPMIDGVLKELNISREEQIKVSLQDVSTGKYIIQDSKSITILSKNDMKWQSDDGKETYYENICAWVTPESTKIKDLLRNSIDLLTEWTGGKMSAIVGYQEIGLTHDEITYYQVKAMYETMRNFYKVRYNATPISTSGKEAQQRIALPEEVLDQRSGLCIETAITLASAVEATGMHAMILILPGHAQVAVETWRESGQYFLIETTALTQPDWDKIIYYPTQEEWNNYLQQNQVTVVDVELARKDGIKPMQ
jgi:hypothetical protein